MNKMIKTSSGRRAGRLRIGTSGARYVIPGVHPVRDIQLRWMGVSCYGWTLRNAESMPHSGKP
jgi:hypothetical protein